MKLDSPAHAANATPGASSVPVSAAVSGFTPKTKQRGSQRETSDMDVSGTIILQNEGRASESPRITRKKSMSSAAKASFEVPMVQKPIGPEDSTALHENIEGKSSRREAVAGKGKDIRGEVDNGEGMQVDNDQMQGGSHPLTEGFLDVDKG